MEVFSPVILIVLLLVMSFLFINKLFYVPKSKLEKLDNHYRHQEIEKARLQEKNDSLENLYLQAQQKAKEEHEKRYSLEREKERLLANIHERENRIQEQLNESEQTKKQLQIEFQNLAHSILDEKSNKFTELNKENLNHILTPFKEKLLSFEEKVDKTYQKEASERSELKGVVKQLMEQSAEIRSEANNLTKALKGDTKKQGNWGEVILERVLERSGLVKDREYRLQVSLPNENGKRSQPDAIIDLPEKKHLIVDAKVSLTAYEKWVNADHDAGRSIAAKQHVFSIENHVKELSNKNYHQLYGINSPDFVLLFMPIESALSLAVTEKPEIFGDAWERNVVIVSPSTLLATLRTIASMWKQELQNRNVLEIADEAGKLYDKFVGFLKDMEQVQSMLNRAEDKHQNALKKLSTGSGNIIRKIELLKKLGAKANKQIDQKYLD